MLIRNGGAALLQVERHKNDNDVIYPGIDHAIIDSWLLLCSLNPDSETANYINRKRAVIDKIQIRVNRYEIERSGRKRNNKELCKKYGMKYKPVKRLFDN